MGKKIILTAVFLILLMSVSESVNAEAKPDIRKLVYISPDSFFAVVEEEYEQKLYFNKNLLITDRYIDIVRVVPELKEQIFLIVGSAGGSGTLPCYQFVTVHNKNLLPEVSECLGTGVLEKFESDGKTVRLKFEASYNNVDPDIMMEPACIVEYKDGKIFKDGKLIISQKKPVQEAGKSQTETDGKTEKKTEKKPDDKAEKEYTVHDMCKDEYFIDQLRELIEEENKNTLVSLGIVNILHARPAFYGNPTYEAWEKKRDKDAEVKKVMDFADNNLKSIMKETKLSGFVLTEEDEKNRLVKCRCSMKVGDTSPSAVFYSISNDERGDSFVILDKIEY